MTLRCPYCHDAIAADGPRCRGCQASAHASCALELARCASCGDSRWEGLPQRPTDEWGRRAGAGGATFARASLEPLSSAPPAGVRLDVQRHAEPAGGLLAGTLWVSLPRGAARPGVDLVWIGPQTERRVPLLIPRAAPRRPEPGWRHRVDFRTPAPPWPGARLALDVDGRLRVWPAWHGVEAGREPQEVSG